MPENRLEIIISLVLKEYPVGLKPRTRFSVCNGPLVLKERMT